VTTPALDPARFEALDADRWARVLGHVRAVLSGLPTDELGVEGARLAAMPTSRLSGGRGMRSLCDWLAASPVALARLAQRLETAGEESLLEDLRVEESGADAVGAHGTADAHGPADARRAPPPADSSARDRDRLRKTRQDRDAALRRAEGAEARAQRLAAQVETLEARIGVLEQALDDARTALEDADRERARAVERERRRQDARIVQLETQIVELRRVEDERRAAARRARDRERDATASPTPSPAPSTPPPSRVVPGRPTRLPDGMHPDTREAADLLLDRGRLVLVDGYNVTKQHRPAATLEEQRAWLVQLLATAVARRGIRPTVLFDGERAGGAPAARGVQVRFTDEGVTADDEIVLWVEATDEPVVVVTDDRELTERVRESAADVLATAPFVWAIR
jgi:outer membrane murein-binding lipoprotein Lpp